MAKNLMAIISITLLVLQPISDAQAIDKQAVPNTDLIGTWQGEGKIIVNWCKQKQLSMNIQIDSEANVSGEIGDAYIRNGKIRLNNIIYRWIGNREYIVEAELSGFLIEKEKISRESIRLFLDFKNHIFIGGFHSSGSKFGGKEKMALSGTKVKLLNITR